MIWPTKKLGEIYRGVFGISVPFVQQSHINSCGAAALEMIYRYYGIKNVDQMDIFNRHKKPNPVSTSDFYIETDDLINDSQQRGFNNARWERIDINNRDLTTGILSRFIKKGIPTIACQQFTEERPDIGHFRVILKANPDCILVHDPHFQYGGKKVKWTIEKFINFWRPTGNNVTGGVLIIIEK